MGFVKWRFFILGHKAFRVPIFTTSVPGQMDFWVKILLQMPFWSVLRPRGHPFHWRMRCFSDSSHFFQGRIIVRSITKIKFIV
ncbi:hypothetical protein EHQ76_20140 [Leptospira barantonii]|uniref:Uncharacterized protein n=1 Tax=Leptospira barantonii TaxID=2023184 RepID=A0A5F2B1L4_9LEPT|nr:hypothetical protein EHQ76_20140 [Leptospira barantonii]